MAGKKTPSAARRASMRRKSMRSPSLGRSSTRSQTSTMSSFQASTDNLSVSEEKRASRRSFTSIAKSNESAEKSGKDDEALANGSAAFLQKLENNSGSFIEKPDAKAMSPGVKSDAAEPVSSNKSSDSVAKSEAKLNASEHELANKSSSSVEKLDAKSSVESAANKSSSSIRAASVEVIAQEPLAANSVVDNQSAPSLAHSGSNTLESNDGQTLVSAAEAAQSKSSIVKTPTTASAEAIALSDQKFKSPSMQSVAVAAPGASKENLATANETSDDAPVPTEGAEETKPKCANKLIPQRLSRCRCTIC